MEEEFLDRKSFKKIIQLEQYVRVNCRNPTTGRTIYIYLMKTDSKYIKATPNFKKLIDSLGQDPADVYIITKMPLSIYINKILHKFSNLKILNFLHRHFSIEITRGPHCSKHTILTDEEVIKTCFQDLMIHPLSIPPIFVTDPICIWIGAEIGQVIRIEADSEISGKVIRYRIVSPKVGRIPVSKTPNIASLGNVKKIVADQGEEEAEPEDDSEVYADTEVDNEVDVEVDEVETKEADDGTDLYDIDEDIVSDIESDVEA
jgi:DNA-directed RNA polymerase subunit H (RpoH/RPB5)